MAAACCGVLLQAAGARAAVNVSVEAPSVSVVEFDRRTPPPDMPRAGADGGAVCSNVFEIEATIASSVEALSPTTVRTYPDNIDIITRLKVTIYLPRDAPAKLRAHEEGHRAIGEHYYADAESAARDAAASLIGRTFEAGGVDRSAAEQEAGRLVLAALKDAFMQRTHARSAAANTRYDALTDHGRNAIKEADAIADALAGDPL
jgi:hypothetical protein